MKPEKIEDRQTTATGSISSRQDDAADGWWTMATQRPVVRRALGYAVVVGAILILINHGDAIVNGRLTAGLAVRMGLTVCVPYLVSTFSSVSALRAQRGRPASSG